MFVGYTISSMILPRLADINGRKSTFRRFYVLQVIGMFTILFFPSYIGIYIGLFLVGSASTMRTAVGYVYSLEFIETSKQNKAGTVMKTFDVTTPIWISILFMTVSNDWRDYYIIGFIVAFVAWVSSFMIPESPSFLLA